ncbi:hypothetical protein DF185_22250 [Marinifilum breve]|uniref:Uncharacterized protein n=1 Tax=Marinifilum breve TaxID=2184082 RepID=A0A2V3ZRW4_9BACT|nr:hypothetical protein [Marinifilum breve]PXX95441.1 hypothetical protein DF185_22250 [Marinifilum breve]
MKYTIILLIVILVIGCGDYYKNRVEPLEINGVVLEKYRDKNRDYPRLIINNNNSEILLTLYDYETSGLWNYLQKGDSIYKSKGELVFFVSRNGTKKKFTLQY